MVFTEFRLSGPVDTDIEAADTEVIWKLKPGEWQAKVPEGYITSNGLARLIISGTGMAAVAIDLVVGNIGGGGGTQVVNTYTIDPTAKTITPTGITLTQEQIIEIRNLTKNIQLYHNQAPSRSGASISVSGGVITYTFDGTVGDTDKIRIEYNPV